MAALMTPELLSLLFGSLTGFIFKTIAIREQNKADQFNRMMTAIDKADNSADKASQRDGESGKWIRRVIVLAVLFSVILAPFVLALLKEPVVSQLVVRTPSYFFGLFGGNEKTVFVKTYGYLMIPEIRTCFLSICGYYYGQAAAKANG